MERVEADGPDVAVVWQAVHQPAIRAGRSRHVCPVAPLIISLFKRAELMQSARTDSVCRKVPVF